MNTRSSTLRVAAHNAAMPKVRRTLDAARRLAGPTNRRILQIRADGERDAYLIYGDPSAQVSVRAVPIDDTAGLRLTVAVIPPAQLPNKKL